MRSTCFSPVGNPWEEGNTDKAAIVEKEEKYRRLDYPGKEQRVDAGIEGVTLKATSGNIVLRDEVKWSQTRVREIVTILNMCAIRTLMENGPRIQK